MNKNKKPKFVLTDIEKSYIAGFLDGDGSILTQIVKKEDYTFGFQIRFSIIFFQKTSKHWFLLQLSKKLKYGTLRKRKDNMSEYAIVGKDVTEEFLREIYSFLQLKKPLARLVLSIIQDINKVSNLNDFIKVCEKVDQTAQYTYSKKRTITSDTVQEYHNK